MRVNLISNNRNTTGLCQDVDLFQGIFSIVFPDAKFSRVHHSAPSVPEADLNVFFEVINAAHFVYAGKNALIPNPEWTYKTWTPYLSQFDFLWCKTQDAVATFGAYTGDRKPVYTGWSSIAKGVSEKKNYHKAIVVTGKNIFRHPQILIDAYQMFEDVSKLPELHIVYDGTRMNVNVPTALFPKIKLYPDTLPQKKYDELLAECGLAICLSGAEGFGHAVNEAASSGCNLLLSDIPAFQELGYDATWVAGERTESDRLDAIMKCKRKDVMVALDTYTGISFKERKEISKRNANAYLDHHNGWIYHMKSVLQTIEIPEFSLSEGMIPEADLPHVSIITPTKDRLKFMEVCAGMVAAQCYPHEKLEWIVVDDGLNTCEDVIRNIPFAKHVIVMQGKTIAEKRNLGVLHASHPILVHFDDDDVYPSNSILVRVSMLLRTPQPGAVFCTTLPSYDITNYVSFYNVPPSNLSQSERVSEATLAYTRAFWNVRQFPDVTIAEGQKFLEGREDQCRELSPLDIIVSLVHPQTTSSRRAPTTEANGCHYGFSEELFTILSEIGASL